MQPLAPAYSLSAKHNDRNIGQSQYFRGMAAQHDPAHADATVRGHHDDVATAFAGSVENAWRCSAIRHVDGLDFQPQSLGARLTGARIASASRYWSRS